MLRKIENAKIFKQDVCLNGKAVYQKNQKSN